MTTRMTDELWQAADQVADALLAVDGFDLNELRKALSYLSAHRDAPASLFTYLDRLARDREFSRSRRTREHRQALHRALLPLYDLPPADMGLVIGAAVRKLYYLLKMKLLGLASADESKAHTGAA